MGGFCKNSGHSGPPWAPAGPKHFNPLHPRSQASKPQDMGNPPWRTEGVSGSSAPGPVIQDLISLIPLKVAESRPYC